MTSSKFLTVFILIIFIASSKDHDTHQAKFYYFGTEIDVSLYGVTNEIANSTIGRLEQSFSYTNRTWHAWQPSTLTDINTAIRNGKSIMIAADIEAVINQAQVLAVSSQHLFNPAAGNLFQLWGYHSDNWFESRPPPSEESIKHWLSLIPTMEDISINKGVLSSSNKKVKLGFGGFAKGYAVNQAIASLQQIGIENAIVNIGGDLRVIGSHGIRPWIIGISHPRKKGILASIELNNNESIFSSGDYERFFEYEGTRYPHILDPRTGYPAKYASSVTVLHNDAAKADAAATALFVAGNNWPYIAAMMRIDYVMLVKSDGQIEISPKMMERINLIIPQQKPIIRKGIAISKTISP